MDRQHAEQLLGMLGARKIGHTEEWVRASCPLATWKHERGTDRRPSFGIRIGAGSRFHCYSCHIKGRVQLLPTLISSYTLEDMPEVRNFIMKYSYQGTQQQIDVSRLPSAPIITGSKLKQFKITTRMRKYITKDWKLPVSVIKQFGLLYDNKEGRILIPVYDINKRLVGIKGRCVRCITCSENCDVVKYREYTELITHKKIVQGRKLSSYKSYGILYGVHDPLVPNKAITLVEGEKDRLFVVLTKTVSNTWSIGSSNITPAQLYTLKELELPVILFLDNDKAGREARRYLIDEFRGVAPVYSVRDYCGEKDPARIIQVKKLDRALKSIRPEK